MPRSIPRYQLPPRPPKTPYRLYTNPHNQRLTVEFIYLNSLPTHLELPTPITSLLSVKYRDLLPLATREAIVTEVLFTLHPTHSPEPSPCPPTPTPPSSSPAASTPSKPNLPPRNPVPEPYQDSSPPATPPGSKS